MRGVATLNEPGRGLTLVKELFKYLVTGGGLLTLGTGGASCVLGSRPDRDAPDAQLMFVPGSDARPSVLESEPGMSMGLWPSHPRSHGTVSARSADPYSPPPIRLNFLSDDETAASLPSACARAGRSFPTGPRRRTA